MVCLCNSSTKHLTSSAFTTKSLLEFRKPICNSVPRTRRVRYVELREIFHSILKRENSPLSCRILIGVYLRKVYSQSKHNVAGDKNYRNLTDMISASSDVQIIVNQQYIHGDNH